MHSADLASKTIFRKKSIFGTKTIFNKNQRGSANAKCKKSLVHLSYFFLSFFVFYFLLSFSFTLSCFLKKFIPVVFHAFFLSLLSPIFSFMTASPMLYFFFIFSDLSYFLTLFISFLAFFCSDFLLSSFSILFILN